MVNVLRHKFGQNEDLKAVLLETGFVTLVEASLDEFWASGRQMWSPQLKWTSNWTGQNSLGGALGIVREEMRNLAQWVPINNRYVVAQVWRRNGGQK